MSHILSPLTDKPNIWPQWVDDLVHIAMFYSNYEIGCELSGVSHHRLV